jgi:polyisoprenoid-binding protein YceI
VHTEASSLEANREAKMAHYTIDASRSRFTLQAFATGLLSAMGHNPTFAIRKFSGEVVLDAASLERSSIRINIDPASIEVTDDRDSEEIERRMRDEVLEINRFSEIVYHCDRVSGSGTGGQYWVTLQGELSLHGVTQPLPISSTVTMAENSLRANGSFSVRQTDFDIELVSALGGAIRVKDEIKFSFDIVAPKMD